MLQSAPQDELVSNLVQGDVVMGVRPSLPMREVQVIVGNDLAGSPGKPEVSVDTLSTHKGKSKSPRTSSTVHIICAVLHAMSPANGDSCSGHSDKKKCCWLLVLLSPCERARA